MGTQPEIQEERKKVEARTAALFDRPVAEIKKVFLDLIDQRLPKLTAKTA